GLGEMLRQDMLGHCVVLAEDGVLLPPRYGRPARRITVRDGGIDVSGAADKMCTELRTFSEQGLDKALPDWRASSTGSSDPAPHSLRNEENVEIAAPDGSGPETISDGAAQPVVSQPVDDPLEIPAFLRRQPTLAAASQRPAPTMRPGPPSDDD